MAKKEKAAVDMAAYVENRVKADSALANIRTIRAEAKDAKGWIAQNEAAVKKALDEAGGRLVVGETLMEFTKGRQIRLTAVAVQ